MRDSGDRVMLVRGTPGVGQTTLLQQGGSALVQALRDTTA
jgi:adenylate kinase